MEAAEASEGRQQAPPVLNQTLSEEILFMGALQGKRTYGAHISRGMLLPRLPGYRSTLCFNFLWYRLNVLCSFLFQVQLVKRSDSKSLGSWVQPRRRNFDWLGWLLINGHAGRWVTSDKPAVIPIAWTSSLVAGDESYCERAA